LKRPLNLAIPEIGKISEMYKSKLTVRAGWRGPLLVKYIGCLPIPGMHKRSKLLTFFFTNSQTLFLFINFKTIRTMKKLFFTIIATFLPMMASAYDAQIGDFYYNFNSTDHTAEVTNKGSYFGYRGILSIPSKVTYNNEEYDVTSIGNQAFQDCPELKSISIPSSVTVIGYQAFYGCSGLYSVTIPNSVTSIGSSAFYGCSGLTSVNIPDGLTTIETFTFAYCTSLPSITIPNSVTKIDSWAFSGCIVLHSVTIPKNVTYMGGYAFANCI